MKNTKTKKIIFILIFIFIPFAFSNAENININGMTFVVGKHEPQKRVHYFIKNKDQKVLKIQKQPAHGRKLKLEETEEYIESHKSDLSLQQNINNIELPSSGIKENIKNIKKKISLDTILKLNPITYNYKNKPEKIRVGFVAEDIPDLIATSNGNSLSAINIVTVAIGAIQHIWDKIVLMEEHILDISNRLAIIERKLNIQNTNDNFESNENTDNQEQEDQPTNDNQEENNQDQQDNQDTQPEDTSETENQEQVDDNNTENTDDQVDDNTDDTNPENTNDTNEQDLVEDQNNQEESNQEQEDQSINDNQEENNQDQQDNQDTQPEDTSETENQVDDNNTENADDQGDNNIDE